jgi:hypothetical protein
VGSAANVIAPPPVTRDARLLQIERDHGALERHVLHRLHHRGAVVELAGRIGLHTDVGGRERGPQLRSPAHPARHRDRVGEAEVVALLLQILERVAGADHHEAQVGPPALLHEDARHVDEAADAVLRIHVAEVAHDDASEPPDRRIGRRRRKLAQVGSVPHDRHVLGLPSPAPDCDLLERLVGRDHMVGEREVLSLHPTNEREHGTSPEPLLEELGDEVVVVEHELDTAAQLVGERHEPGEVGRVGRMDRIDAGMPVDPEGEERLRAETRRILGDVPPEALAELRLPVAPVLDAVDLVPERLAFVGGAHDRHTDSRLLERLRLSSDPRVVPIRPVLDQEHYVKHRGSRASGG